MFKKLLPVTAFVLIAVCSLFAVYFNFFYNPYKQEDIAFRAAADNALQRSAITDKESEKESAYRKNAEKYENTTGTVYGVRFKDSVSLAKINKILSEYTYIPLSESKDRMFAIKTDNIDKFKAQYEKLCEYIQQDRKQTTFFIPNDPGYSDQWALDALNLPEAWDMTTGKKNVYVAVIDTGLYRNNVDYNGANIANGYDFSNNTAYVNTDKEGHGTATTSVIAAATNNGIGMAGAAFNVTAVPMKVADNYGNIYSTTVVRAINMAVAQGCDVINLSLGEYEYDLLEADAVKNAIEAGCIVVASAGNEGDIGNKDRGKLCYPASLPGVISVASISENGSRSDFSQFNSEVDVTAPGDEILVLSNSAANPYALGSGTSFSSPYVAAIAALARSVDDNINAEEFLQLIKNTSTDLGSAGRDDYNGWGLINAEKLIKAAGYPIVLGVEDGGVYKTPRTITFDRGTGLINGKPFNSGDTVSADGDYRLEVTDSYGKTTVVSFIIDSAPISISGVEDGGIYNTDRTIEFNKYYATLNGAPISSGYVVKNEGTYTLMVKDHFNNNKTIIFTIDKTPPVITGAKDGITYNSNITVSFNEGSALLNGKSFISGSVISTQGIYTLNVTDTAGNSTVISFTMSNSKTDNTEFALNGILSEVAYDDTTDMLFALSKADKSIIIINRSTMGTERVIKLESEPSDIIAESGRIYISFTDKSTVSVINETTGVSLDILNFTASPLKTAKLDGKLYYTDTNGFIYEYNMLTRLNRKLDLNAFANPDIAANPDLKLLYIGESNGSSGRLSYYNIESGSIISTKSMTMANADTAKETSFDGKNVIYGDSVFMADKAELIKQSYETGSDITAAKYSFVMTANGIYEKTSGLKLLSLGYNANLGKISKNGDVFAYNKADGKIYRLINAIDSNDTIPPEITGVSDNQTYSYEATVAFNEGVGYIDGVKVTSGSKVTSSGVHSVKVLDKGGNIAALSFTIIKPVISVAFENQQYSMYAGDSLHLNVSFNPVDADNKNLSFSSDNTSVATVDANGNVKANTAGSVYITVKSQDGNKTAVCTVSVRLKTMSVISDVSINRSTNQITGLWPGMTSSQLISKINGSGGSLRVVNPSGAVINGAVGTGSRLQLLDNSGNTIDELTVIIYGDVNGDGAINAVDLLSVKRKLLGLSSITGPYAAAGNVNRDGAGINSVDLLAIKRQLLGLSKIGQ